MEIKKKILAVEDNTVNLATLEQELCYKYEVVPMSSGNRAIRYLERTKVDLILLDIQMPGMDGIETLQVMRTLENGVNVPVIFLTANQDKSTVIEGSKLGIVDYIVKPFDAKDLHQRIERALNKPVINTIDTTQLILKINEIIDYVHKKNKSNAVIKAEELLGFQLEPEIEARIQGGKLKLKENDYAAANRIFSRILMLIKYNDECKLKNSLQPISPGELNSRLLYILADLQNFKITAATEKLEDLLNYAIPDHIFYACTKAKECLATYDDGGAEELIRDSLCKL